MTDPTPKTQRQDDEVSVDEFATDCTEDCPDDCMADHRGEE